MYRLGGRRTLRGYAEEQFLTPRAVWVNLELGTFQRSGFKGYLFGDLGYLRLSNLTSSQDGEGFADEFLHGAGFGMRLFSENSGLDFSVGWGEADSFRTGKVYLILENRF